MVRVVGVAEQLVGVPVFVGDGCAGETEELGIRESGPQELAQLPFLGAVRLINEDDDVLPGVQHPGVLEFVNGGEDDTAPIFGEDPAQVSRRVGSFQGGHPGAQELAIHLGDQLHAVCDQDDGWVLKLAFVGASKVERTLISGRIPNP